jgi:hypothetical protein
MQKGCRLYVCRGKHIFITLPEGWTMDDQEEEGHNNSFSLWTGQDSVIKSVEEEENLKTFSQLLVLYSDYELWIGRSRPTLMSWILPRWTENYKEITQSRWPVSTPRCEPGGRRDTKMNCKPWRPIDPWFYCKLCSSCRVSCVPLGKTLIITLAYNRGLLIPEAAAWHSLDSRVLRGFIFLFVPFSCLHFSQKRCRCAHLLGFLLLLLFYYIILLLLLYNIINTGHTGINTGQSQTCLPWAPE